MRAQYWLRIVSFTLHLLAIILFTWETNRQHTGNLHVKRLEAPRLTHVPHIWHSSVHLSLTTMDYTIALWVGEIWWIVNACAETAIKLLPVKFLSLNLKFPWAVSYSNTNFLAALRPRFIRDLREKLLS